MTQTKRHSFIANLLGIKHIIVAVNKMDLVGFKEHIFLKKISDYAVQVLSHMNFSNVDFI